MKTMITTNHYISIDKDYSSYPPNYNKMMISTRPLSSL